MSLASAHRDDALRIGLTHAVLWFTTLVMIAFAVVVLTMASYAWFGSWQPEVRRVKAPSEAEVQAAVDHLRRAIDDYERGDRTL